MGDIIRSLILALVPPVDADQAATYRWRVSVAVLLLAIGGLSVANTIVMFGFWPALFAGFATNVDIIQIKQQQSTYATRSDIQQLKGTLDNINEGIKSSRIGALTTQLYNLRVLQCSALKAGNIEAARSHDQQLQDLELEWRNLKGYDYTRRPCNEL
jgi:hypothetical protein